jgi:hypothetical protein
VPRDGWLSAAMIARKNVENRLPGPAAALRIVA